MYCSLINLPFFLKSPPSSALYFQASHTKIAYKDLYLAIFLQAKSVPKNDSNFKPLLSYDDENVVLRI